MNTHQKFISGLRLGELFFREIIEPILKNEFPQLKYSAALIGEGSEILGYDTFQSTDHCWGPRAMLFLTESDYKKRHADILKALMTRMPAKFMGYSTELNCPVKNTVDIFSIQSFFEKYLAVDPVKKFDIFDWLTFPSQKLLEVTSGKIFHDDLGLEETRKEFAYYPHDIWLYLLSCQWTKIGQEEAFAGRCHQVGDELGSQIVAARMVRELMKLCFLLEKKYAPYSKWFGTGFKELRCFQKLSPIFTKVLSARSWKTREKYLSRAHEFVADMHNALQITPPLSAKVSKYYDRPYLVIHADRFAEALRKEIKNPKIQSIETKIGAIDQFIDSTDVLTNSQFFKKLRIWSKS